MKKTIAFLIMLLASASLFAYSSFCEGWEDGFGAGYCYRNYACIAPIAPICPLPRLGENTYKDGYNRGFIAGLNAR